MAYIIKNTAGLINTRLTDVGRRYISQGDFNISYFQIGDSEVNYNAVTNYNQVNNNILMPAFNAQNDTGSPQSNKQNIKYPYFVSGNQGNTYGIPFMDSNFDEVYNAAGPKGFFTSAGTQIQTSSAYTITSNYFVDMASLTGGTTMVTEFDNFICNQTTTGTPQVNDFVTIVLDGIGGCGNFSSNQILTYKIQSMNPTSGLTGTTFTLTLDREIPSYQGLTPGSYYSRVYIYPSGMTQLYDSITPEPYWQTDTLNFESPCDVRNRENTVVWNMNIPWSESPAGVFSSAYENYTKYGSVTYIGTKEYLGYQEPSGQTDTSQVYYNNSFDEKIVVRPQDQKAISIIHYTNQDIDFVYGEKFSTIPYDPQNPTDDIGLARHFKLTMPTLLWHKSTGATVGQTFWIDPPGYDLCKPYYIKSTKNLDMNDPGMRYFHLWDLNPDDNGNLNRIGKVFPDQEIIVIDDEEVIASLSYKSNRNWTLPAPKLTTIIPNICDPNGSQNGLLTNPEERLWLTYRFDTVSGATSSLHCNYYTAIQAPISVTANTLNVAVRFGSEFPYLQTSSFSGFSATSMKLLCQIVTGDTRPSPTLWREIDVTTAMTLSNGFITQSSLTGTTFTITPTDYTPTTGITQYQLNNYIDIPTNGQTDVLNFGDEFYFYGNLDTDISATIYEMKYLVNLGTNQFTNTSNPTWMSGTTSYVTEIGLYNQNKDLMVVSKLQSPELRQGIQQYVVKLDF
jgi:hypothetical protein